MLSCNKFIQFASVPIGLHIITLPENQLNLQEQILDIQLPNLW